MGEKAEFIRAVVVRLSPEPERAEAAIDRGEALWDALCRRGYGPNVADGMKNPSSLRELPPIAGRWDGLPPPKLMPGSSFHPAFALAKAAKPEPSKEEKLDQAQRDLAHWHKLATNNPDKEEIQFVFQQVLQRYEELTGDTDEHMPAS